ncbi:MAG TPA: class E sortase [Mycobacteriales bacterium]|jgi:sortase A|nr:class E sortase [Mycobacteriales bacterium]
MQDPTTGSVAPSFLPAPTPQPRSLGSLLGLSLRRPGGRRAVSLLTVVLLVSGVSMFAFPAFTDLFQRFQQRHVQLNTSDPGLQTRYLEHKIKVGQGLTRLVINNDRMKVNVVVVEGTTPAALNAGAGHYVNTPFPCERGNVGIAGHRTTYGRPFNKIDEMHVGDTVDLITPVGRCTYAVVKAFGGHSNPWVVLPNAYYVVSQDGALGRGHWLTLTSCHPLGSDSHRIVLRLRLVKSTGKA